MLPRFRRAAYGLAGALCAALLACSGASGGPTAPDAPPDDGPPAPLPAPHPAPPEVEPPDHVPGPPQPIENVISGTYVLARINDSEPGQTVTLTNPDGTVIGLYRFHQNTTLGLTERQTWSLSVHFQDEAESHDLEDQGTFKRFGANLEELSFSSDTFGDLFPGRAQNAVAAIYYDIDGNGQGDTYLVFVRILGPGE